MLLVVLFSVFGSFALMCILTVIFQSVMGLVIDLRPNGLGLLFAIASGYSVAMFGGFMASEIPFYFGEDIYDSINAITGLAILTGFMSLFCLVETMRMPNNQMVEPIWFHGVLLVVSNIGIMNGAMQSLAPNVLLGNPFFILSHIPRL